MKSFEGALISRDIIDGYFETELMSLNELIEKSALLESELDEIEKKNQVTKVCL